MRQTSYFIHTLFRTTFYVLIFTFTTFLLSSCAAILNFRKQPVTLTTGNSEATIYVNDNQVGKGNQVKIKLKRDGRTKQIKIEAAGYKPSYYSAIQYRRSPLCYFTGFPFIYLFVFDSYSKSFNYPKSIETLPNVKTISHSDNLKFIRIDSISFKNKNSRIGDATIKYKFFKKYTSDSSKLYKKSSFSPYNVEKMVQLQLDESYFNNLQKYLKTNGFLDTTNYIYKRYNDNLLLNLSINNLTFYDVLPNDQNYNDFENNFIYAEADIKWEVKNVYGEILSTKLLKSRSGQFSPYYYNNNDEITKKKALDDLFENSLNTLILDPSIGNILEKDSLSENEKLSDIMIDRPKTKIDSIEDVKAACVIIKTKDKTGSGFVISNDGYIITNYHLISTQNANKQKEITVITSGGEKLKCTLIRVCITEDLALLKIDKNFTSCFNLPDEKNYQFGDEIFSFGVSGPIGLNQSLSKGTLSSDRKTKSFHLIQININLNKENYGAPLFKGGSNDLIGIVCGKLSGYGVEGIAFGIPAFKIKNYLKLSYK